MKRLCLIAGLLMASLSLCWIASADDEDAPKPVMVDAANGWRVRTRSHGDTVLGYAIQHTTDGGKHWQDVSPAALRRLNRSAEQASPAFDPPGLSVVDARRAWAQVNHASENLWLEYTDDGGEHWQQKAAHIKGIKWGATAVTSFVDKEHGFLLDMGEPALGHMEKVIYVTKDGGKHWRELDGLPSGQYYPTGITFRTPKQGWITGTNHGEPAVPFFRTIDGGQNWELQTLGYPKGIKEVLGGNTYPPVFTGPDRTRGQMSVKLVWHDARKAEKQDQDDFIYESEDGGATWHLSASSPQPTPGD